MLALVASGGIGVLIGVLSAIILSFAIAFAVIWLTNLLQHEPHDRRRTVIVAGHQATPERRPPISTIRMRRSAERRSARSIGSDR